MDILWDVNATVTFDPIEFCHQSLAGTKEPFVRTFCDNIYWHFLKRIFRFHHQPISQFSSWWKGYCKKKHLRAHVILRRESCSQSFPTVVAHGQASKEKHKKWSDIPWYTSSKKVPASRDEWWGGGERRRGRQKLTCKAKGWYLSYWPYKPRMCFLFLRLLLDNFS